LSWLIGFEQQIYKQVAANCTLFIKKEKTPSEIVPERVNIENKMYVNRLAYYII
jgi:hypothetical protein